MEMYGNNVGLLSQNESLQINHGIKFDLREFTALIL